MYSLISRYYCKVGEWKLHIIIYTAQELANGNSCNLYSLVTIFYCRVGELKHLVSMYSLVTRCYSRVGKWKQLCNCTLTAVTRFYCRVGEWKLLKGSTYGGAWDSWYGPSGRTGYNYSVQDVR